MTRDSYLPPFFLKIEQYMTAFKPHSVPLVAQEEALGHSVVRGSKQASERLAHYDTSSETRSAGDSSNDCLPVQAIKATRVSPSDVTVQTQPQVFRLSSSNRRVGLGSPLLK